MACLSGSEMKWKDIKISRHCPFNKNLEINGIKLSAIRTESHFTSNDVRKDLVPATWLKMSRYRNDMFQDQDFQWWILGWQSQGYQLLGLDITAVSSKPKVLILKPNIRFLLEGLLVVGLPWRRWRRSKRGHLYCGGPISVTIYHGATVTCRLCWLLPAGNVATS